MSRGFTSIEVLLSVVLVGVLVSFSAVVYQSLQNRTLLDTTMTAVRTSYFRAQMLARTGYADGMWGVYATTSQVIVFQGASYAARDTNYDEVTTIPDTMVLGGLPEVVFSQLTGLPDTTGTMTIASPDGGERTVTITNEGVVN